MTRLNYFIEFGHTYNKRVFYLVASVRIELTLISKLGDFYDTLQSPAGTFYLKLSINESFISSSSFPVDRPRASIVTKKFGW